jgi:hypothetical protein
MTITINPQLTLHLPEGYVPPPLPMRDEWVADLRSGVHTQCRHKLHDGTGFCCLGRLSALQGRLTWTDDAEWCDRSNDLDGSALGLSRSNPLFYFLKHAGSFPPGVRCTATFGVVCSSLSSPLSLSLLNDNGVSFDDIATVIEHVWSQPELS